MNAKWIAVGLCWGLGCGLAHAVVVVDQDYRYQIRMTSRADVKKSSENSYSLEEKGTTITDTTSITTTQDVTLSVDIQNRAKEPLSAELKWCFIRESLDQGGGTGILKETTESATLFRSRKVSLSAGESATITDDADFKSFVENAYSQYENTTQSAEKTKDRNYQYGDTYLGYVAVLVVDGKPVAKASNLYSFLDDQMVGQCVAGTKAVEERTKLTSKQIKKLKKGVEFGLISMEIAETSDAPPKLAGKLVFGTAQPSHASSGLNGNYPDFRIRFLCEIMDPLGNVWLMDFAGNQDDTDEEYVGTDEWQVFVPLDKFGDSTVSAYVLQYGIMNDGEFIPFAEKSMNAESAEELMARTSTSFRQKFLVRHRYDYLDEDGEDTQSEWNSVQSRDLGNWK
jgi:hypothetical protein